MFSLRPKGTTPIALTLEKAANDFPDCPGCRNVIILITDGVEECNGDPCEVSLALQKKGIILKPFVIGIGLDVEFRKTFECVGSYYDVDSESSFRNVLNIVISQALNSTTAQVNLLDLQGNPSETNVNMTFYDRFDNRIRYNYVHTMNSRGLPDTLSIDPIHTYRLVVHTIPQAVNDSVTLLPGKHNTIAVDAPQGSLSLKIRGTAETKKIPVIVRKSGELNTLHVMDFQRAEKFLVGTYDLEVLTLPRVLIPDVNISQSHTTTVEVPQPGVVSIAKLSRGYGSVYQEKNNGLIWVCNLTEAETKETLFMQPGNYRVVFRPKEARETIFTVEKSFRVNAGASVAVKLY
ncbi:MAG: hypothetical protein AAGB22_12335 [Bacteroidota bacterium]